jgi:hypothetical protein
VDIILAIVKTTHEFRTVPERYCIFEPFIQV